jgi:hypothetical protein
MSLGFEAFGDIVYFVKGLILLLLLLFLEGLHSVLTLQYIMNMWLGILMIFIVGQTKNRVWSILL